MRIRLNRPMTLEEFNHGIQLIIVHFEQNGIDTIESTNLYFDPFSEYGKKKNMEATENEWFTVIPDNPKKKKERRGRHSKFQIKNK